MKYRLRVFAMYPTSTLPRGGAYYTDSENKKYLLYVWDSKIKCYRAGKNPARIGGIMKRLSINIMNEYYETNKRKSVTIPTR